MAGTLYLVPNTLGHAQPDPAQPLSHIIPDDVQAITAKLGYFIAENAKTTRAFLKLVSTVHPLAKSIQEITIAELNVNTKADALPTLLQPILDGQDGGLISEAGVPAVADPGANLVRLAHQLGIPVKPLVGPSSLLLAVMASGLHGQSFAFNGYLPTDAAERAKKIKALEDRSIKDHQTQIFIETPYRNGVLLDALATTCKGDTLICIATDLTGVDERVTTQTTAQWRKQIAEKKTPDLHRKPTVFLVLGN